MLAGFGLGPLQCQDGTAQASNIVDHLGTLARMPVRHGWPTNTSAC